LRAINVDTIEAFVNVSDNDLKALGFKVQILRKLRKAQKGDLEGLDDLCQEQRVTIEEEEEYLLNSTVPSKGRTRKQKKRGKKDVSCFTYKPVPREHHDVSDQEEQVCVPSR
jgi:hypothetical protein